MAGVATNIVDQRADCGAGTFNDLQISMPASDQQTADAVTSILLAGCRQDCRDDDCVLVPAGSAEIGQLAHNFLPIAEELARKDQHRLATHTVVGRRAAIMEFAVREWLPG